MDLNIFEEIGCILRSCGGNSGEVKRVRENVVPRLLALDKKQKYLAINKKQ